MKKWKKYGAAVMAGVVLIGVCVQGDALHGVQSVIAEETEETQRVTLNIVGDDETEENTDAQKAASDDTDENVEETVEETVAADASDVAEEETEEENQEDGTETSEGNALGAGASVESVKAASGSIVMTDVSEIVENCMPSIVSITSVSEDSEDDDSDSAYYYYYAEDGAIVFEDADTDTVEEESTASGIIIAQSDTELLIATNYHVVSDGDEILIGFSVEAEDEDDLIVSGKVKGTSSSTDLAVIAVELSDIEDAVLEQLRIANLGSSADLKVGQATVTISNALGYGQSATTGIISALDREVNLDDTIMEVIVTDAAVNLGSSGGALLNASGEVIGICVAKETGDSSEGMGYFIPIDTAAPVLEQLSSKETRDKLSDSERGYIGATVLTVSDEAVGTYNMPAGAFVYEVTEGSAAEEAGLKNGDIITAIEGESVTSSDELIEKMCYYAPGETITLEVQTANNGTYEAWEAEITLQEGTSSAADETEDAAGEEEETEDASQDAESRPDRKDDSSDTPDEFADGFNDGFDDGFEDYNSQFN